MEARIQVPLEQLVYELLDAHQDTVKLTAQQRVSREWDVHCDYLKDLQQVALEAVGLREYAVTA